MCKRAVLYARVSTDDQADKGYSLPSQFEAMRKYAAQFALSGHRCEKRGRGTAENPRADGTQANVKGTVREFLLRAS